MTGGIPSTADRIKLLEDSLNPEQKLWYIAFPGLHQYIIVVAKNPEEARELFKKCSPKEWLSTLCTVFTSEEWKKFKSAYPLEPNAVLQ